MQQVFLRKEYKFMVAVKLVHNFQEVFMMIFSLQEMVNVTLLKDNMAMTTFVEAKETNLL